MSAAVKRQFLHDCQHVGVRRAAGLAHLALRPLKSLRRQPLVDALYPSERRPLEAAVSDLPVTRPQKYVKGEEGERRVPRAAPPVSLQYHLDPGLQRHVSQRRVRP